MTPTEEFLSFEPKDEIDLPALRTACAGFLQLHGFVPIHPKVIIHLIDQFEAAQKDAARYQWLRTEGVMKKNGMLIDVVTGENLDSAIDAAMSSQAVEE